MNIPLKEDGSVDMERMQRYCSKRAKQFEKLEEAAQEELSSDEMDWDAARKLADEHVRQKPSL